MAWWRRKRPEPEGPPWWTEITCTCPHRPRRHVLWAGNRSGQALFTPLVMTPDEAHQATERIMQTAFALTCGEFALPFSITLHSHDRRRTVDIAVLDVSAVVIDDELLEPPERG